MQTAKMDVPPTILSDRRDKQRRDQNGIVFEVPRDWVERTVVALAAPAEPGVTNAPNVVLTEEPLGEHETLQAHSNRQLAELAKQLADFELLESSDAPSEGAPARFVCGDAIGAHASALDSLANVAMALGLASP